MVEAVFSKYKKQNMIIFIVIAVLAACWFAYDGYVNSEFIEKHTIDGMPDSTLNFNQKSPPVFLAIAAFFATRFFMLRNNKIVAGETAIDISGKVQIAYDSIESVDKTHFDKKGYFILTYKDSNGVEVKRRFSDKSYDKIDGVLERIIEKIS